MKVLIIGLGSIAKKHIAAIIQLEEAAEIFALRSNHKSKSNISEVIDVYDINDMAVKDLDFILISNPTSEHFSTIQKLAEFNKPLFIEKPLFSQINEETEALVDNIEKKGFPTYVACNLRFLDCIKELKNLLKKERINEVNVYCGSFLPDWRSGVDFRKVYSANKEMGGGVHIDLIHELDYVYWLFGEPNQTNSFFTNVSSLNISSYDYANYLWTYKNFSASIILNYFRKEAKRSIEVVTDNGIYYVDLLKNSIEFNNNCIFASQRKIADTYSSQMEFFCENILKGKKKFNTIKEANTILELCMKG